MSGKVAVLMGGISSEREISLRSGRQVLAALPEAEAVVIEADGRWRLGEGAPLELGAAITAMQARYAAAFIALHGPFGEDGVVQGLLEAAGIPYTGSGVMASGLAMDKVRTKMIYRAAGLPTAASLSLDPADFAGAQEAWLARVEAELGYPCVVKPSCDGSSYGVYFADNAAELAEALEAASGVQLLEAALKGQEFTCAVLEREGVATALPVIEIIPDPSYAFFDLEAKYTPGGAQEITPAQISAELTAELMRLSVAAHEALGCRDISRTDFIYDGAQAYLLETNTIPGLTEGSLLPKAAAAAGLSFAELIRVMLSRASR